MENCFYQGKTICTFDLKDQNGFYYEDLVIEWKQAAADRKLTCAECASSVYLAAGQIKEPYFAHYDRKDCEYSGGQESEELKKGKRLLYQLLKRSFPREDVSARHRMENGMFSTLYCHREDGSEIAIDYRLQSNSLKNYQLRDSYYREYGIIPFYVMGMRQLKNMEQIDWYQTLLQNSMGYLVFLNTDKETVTLKKCFGYRLGKERRFKFCIKSYQVKDLLLTDDGRLICDFFDWCRKTEKEIDQEKLELKKQQEQLIRLREENLRYEEREARRLEAYKAVNLNPALLEKCRSMIAEGNAELVSKKYYDAIMSERT